MAMATGELPTAMAVPWVLVAVLMGVTVSCAVVGHVRGRPVGGDGDGYGLAANRDGGAGGVGGGVDGGDAVAVVVGHVGRGPVGGDGNGVGKTAYRDGAAGDAGGDGDGGDGVRAVINHVGGRPVGGDGDGVGSTAHGDGAGGGAGAGADGGDGVADAVDRVGRGPVGGDGDGDGIVAHGDRAAGGVGGGLYGGHGAGALVVGHVGRGSDREVGELVGTRGWRGAPARCHRHVDDGGRMSRCHRSELSGRVHREAGGRGSAEVDRTGNAQVRANDVDGVPAGRRADRGINRGHCWVWLEAAAGAVSIATPAMNATSATAKLERRGCHEPAARPGLAREGAPPVCAVKP